MDKIKKSIEPLLARPLRLEPDNWTENVWGGDWILRLKKWPTKSARPIGESWEFSSHASHPSHVRLSENEKIPLLDLLQSHGEQILGGGIFQDKPGKAPFLIKLIDAQDNLSVQVHPPDNYARLHENENGKAESWIILTADSSPGGGFIYIGFNRTKAAQYANPNEFKRAFWKAIEEANAKGPSDDPRVVQESAQLVLPFLNKAKVKPGDVVNLTPGTIHAIGRGVSLFEIQQTSNVTYRIWDWNRPDPQEKKKGRLAFRPLHLKQAFDVLDFTAREIGAFKIPGKEGVETVLIENASASFAANRICLTPENSKMDQSTNGRFAVLTVVKGAVRLSFQRATENSWQDAGTVAEGHTVLIPAGVRDYRLEAKTNEAEIIKSYVPAGSSS